jgi:hypothetical protein
MKTGKLLFLVMGIFFLLQIVSCKKDRVTSDTTKQTIDGKRITNLLLNFRSRLSLKSDGNMQVDSAKWYVEGLLNFEDANNYHDFFVTKFTEDSVVISYTNGVIPYNLISQAYNYFSQKLQAFVVSQTDTSFQINSVYVSIKGDTSQISGDIVLGMVASGGNRILNYTPFISPESWYWEPQPSYSVDGGRCDPNAPVIYNTAAGQLQWRFNHPIYSRPNGYFINEEEVDMFGQLNPSLPGYPNPGPWCQCMIFWSIGAPSQQPCLGTDELNYYLECYDYLVGIHRPATKEVSNIYVCGIGCPGGGPYNYAKYYEYRVFYGNYIPYNDPGK